MTKYGAAIFDFDGTLADSGPWFLGIINEVADVHGFRKVEGDEIEMLRGRSNREIIRYLGVKTWQLPIIARDVRRRSAEDANQIGLFEGMPELLARWKAAGMQLSIVSSNGEETIRHVLGASADLIDYYGAGVSLFGKAAKFKSLRRHLQLPPGEILAIGDEIRDVEAAQTAGFASAAVTWGFATEQALLGASPNFLARTVGELAEFVVI
ncbi:HAD-IA family hydrolase [Devosia sp. RR2S18]|uniref:HAD-IA family hydrolase n=1 Tax=Devosia rhizosphaerae TaxID=3049774 RepID=UPI002540A781|nr:HAD-IA family hydrolase [Devosia sp. RR2S18]WIJ24499.1 HAD-IA family hydrolase [Devosia sp. RR2S18]